MRKTYLSVALVGLSILLARPADAQDTKELDFVCRATMSAIFGHDISIIKTTGIKDGIASSSYVRPSDGTVWSNRCKIEGNRIIWASDTGRWRTHPMDEVITYSKAGRTLTITQKFDDGSSIVKEFDIP